MNNQPPSDTRYPDLRDGQGEPARDRLDAPSTANHYSPTRSTIPPPVAVPPAGTFTAPTRPARRWSRWHTLAVVVCAVCLVGALSATFYLLQRGAQTSPAMPQPGTAVTPVSTPAQSATAAPGSARGPLACPGQLATPAYWEPVVAPSVSGSHHVEQVSCAHMQGTPALQALVTVRHANAAHTLDVFVFTSITAAHPVKLFQLMGLVQGDAKISAYSTVMTAQADQLSISNVGKPVSAMTADLFREFQWSTQAQIFQQTVFPGLFPDMTRYQAEADQVQVNQGHQAWKLSAQQVAVSLAVSLFNWPTNSTATLLSGGGAHDLEAVVRVGSVKPGSGGITVALSRLEGDLNSSGIWEVTSVNASGVAITSPAPRVQIASPVQVTGTGQAFEGVIGQLIVLDHFYHSLGQATATGVLGMGQTTFSTSLSYQSTFPAGAQEGVLFLSVTSNADGSVAAAAMEKVLIK